MISTLRAYCSDTDLADRKKIKFWSHWTGLNEFTDIISYYQSVFNILTTQLYNIKYDENMLIKQLFQLLYLAVAGNIQ